MMHESIVSLHSCLQGWQGRIRNVSFVAADSTSQPAQKPWAVHCLTHGESQTGSGTSNTRPTRLASRTSCTSLSLQHECKDVVQGMRKALTALIRCNRVHLPLSAACSPVLICCIARQLELRR